MAEEKIEEIVLSYENQASAAAREAAADIDKLTAALEKNAVASGDNEKAIRRALPSIETMQNAFVGAELAASKAATAQLRYDNVVAAAKAAMNRPNGMSEDAGLTVMTNAAIKLESDLLKAAQAGLKLEASFRSMTDAARSAAQGEAAFAFLDAGRAKYDSLFAATQRYESSVRELQDLKLAGVFSDGEAGANAYAAALARVTSEYERADPEYQALAAATEAASRASQQLAKDKAAEAASIARVRAEMAASATQTDIASSYGIGATAKSAASSASVFTEYDQTRRSVDALYASSKAYEETLDKITLLETEFGMSEAKANALRNEAATSFHAMTNAGGGAERTMKNMRYEGLMLSYQLNDVVTSLASGISPMQTFAQQGGQIFQIFQGSGGVGAVLKSTVDMLGGPWVLATGAAAAGLAYLAYVAETTDRALINMQNQLRATRADYDSLGISAISAAKAFASTSGASTADSRLAVQALAASSTFGGDTADLKNLLKLSEDVSAVWGITLPEAAKKLASAMHDPMAAIKEMATSGVPGLSASTVELVKRMADQGRLLEAQRVALDAYRAAADGAAQHTTPLGNAIKDLNKALGDGKNGGDGLGVSIGRALDTVAASAIEAVAKVVNAINSFRAFLNTKGSLGVAAGIYTGAMVGATAGMAGGAVAGSILPGPGTVAGAAIGGVGGAIVGGGLTAAGYYNSGSSPPATFNAASAANSVILGSMVPGQGQAIGMFQIMPATASGMHLDATDPQANIRGGLQTLQTFYNNTGSIPAATAMYGGWGKDVNAAKGYIDTVATGENLKFMSGDVKSAITAWGKALGMSDELIDWGIKIAAVETGGGHQYTSKALNDAAYAPSETNAAIASFKSASNAQVTQNQVWATGFSADTLTAQNRLLEDERTRLEAVQAQLEKGSSAWEDNDQKIHSINNSIETNNISLRKQTDELSKQSPAYAELIDQLNENIAINQAMTSGYRIGADAVGDFTAEMRAASEAHKIFGENTQNSELAIAKLTAQHKEEIKTLADLASSQASLQYKDQIEYIGKENELVGASVEVRNRELAVLKERQRIITSHGDINSKDSQDAIENAKRLADATTQFQIHQQAINDLAGMATQAFDQVGNAITQAFISGQGAAVNWGNVMRGVLTSVVQELMKVAILAPIINSLGATSHMTTLGDMLGAAGSSGSTAAGGVAAGSSALSTGSSLASLGSGLYTLYHAAGSGLFGSTGLLTSGGMLSTASTGGFLGLTGAGGSLFGAGGIAYGGMGASSAAMASAPLAAGEAGVVLPGATASSGAGLLGTATGSILGGIGGGFALGSLGGTLLQGALGKVGPAPMIGAGVGAGAGAGIGFLAGGPVGALVGGLLGGVLGGGGGGLIGPHVASAYSSTSIGLNNGLLATGAYSSQGEAVNIGQTVSDATTINNFLASHGLSISSLGGKNQIGDNTPGGFQDPTKASDLSAAFGGFRFAANDNRLNSYLSGKSFDLATLESDVTAFQNLVGTVIPALTKQSDVTGSLNDAITNINAAYDPAISAALKYGVATDALTAAQTKAIDEANAAAAAQLAATDAGFTARYMTAAASISGDPAAAMAEQLYAFDQNATQQRSALKSQLEAVYGTAYEATSGYADQQAQLERTLGEERLAIQAAYNDKLAATATQGITSLESYVSKLQTGTTSPLSPTAQYDLAMSQFNAVAGAAQAGDYKSFTALPGYADAALTASRTMNGSGTAYANDFSRVLDVLTSLSQVTPDTLTASIYASETKTQTQALVAELKTLQTEVAALRQAVNAPSRIAA